MIVQTLSLVISYRSPYSSRMFTQFLNAPFLIAMLLALTVHEWAHAFVADRLGDPTPREEGRLTLNPVAHLDLVGTLMFFIVSFGWGKPVPVNPRYFRNIRRDSVLVSLAGPLSNLVLASICFLLLIVFAPQIMHLGAAEELLASHGIGARVTAFLLQVLTNSLYVNLALMAFNLLPIAPLDGSKILQGFIPVRYESSYDLFLERGPIILLVLIVLERALNVPILAMWVSTMMNAVFSVFMFFF